MTISNTEALARHLADLLVSKRVIRSSAKQSVAAVISEALKDEEEAGTIKINGPPNFSLPLE
jgi:hypothetical protein